MDFCYKADKAIEAAFFFQKNQHLGKEVNDLSAAINYLHFTTEAAALIPTIFPNITHLKWLDDEPIIGTAEEEEARLIKEDMLQFVNILSN